jgi:hypothetical protein
MRYYANEGPLKDLSALLFLSLLQISTLSFARKTKPSEKFLSALCERVIREKKRTEDRRPGMEAAQSLFRGGVQISLDDSQAVAQTTKLLKTNALVLFDAAFEIEGKVYRASILKRENAKSPWQLFEVFSSKEVKKARLTSRFSRVVAALRSAGIEAVEKNYLYLNAAYREGGSESLFLSGVYTGKIEPLAKSTEEVDTQSEEENEEVFPEQSVMNLTWLHASKRKSLLAKGVSDFAAVLRDYSQHGLTPTPIQLQMLRELTSGQTRFIDAAGLRAGLEKWDLKNPLIYLDFETASPSVPRYPGTAPYQQVPFQFSVDVGDRHFDYLHENATDPRPQLIEALLQAIPVTGSIIAYSKGFESARLREMAQDFPAYAQRLLQIESRLVDPLPILRETVYDLKQHGSYSLKAVAPAFFGTEASYDGMEVADGVAAQAAFDVMIALGTTEAEKKHLRSEMLKYCAKDTQQMVLLVNWMIEASRK